MTPQEFKIWRKDMGWTQQRAGDELGMSRYQINYWERGKRPISRMAELSTRAISAGLANDPILNIKNLGVTIPCGG